MRDAVGSMFGWLLTHRRIPVDPTVGVRRPAASEARKRTLDNSEIRLFWQATAVIGQPFEACLRLLLLTGCRLNEIAQMRWSELNDDLSVLTLPPERVKNGQQHIVPLPPLAQGILRNMPKIENSPFVFTTTGTSPTGSWSRVKRALDEHMLKFARKERGDDVVIKPWVLHDARRTVATGLVDLGVSVDVTEQVLNHQSGTRASVAGIYIRSKLEPEKKAALERWARHIDGVVSGKVAKVVDLDARRA
jgi:integrase